ncbi:MAG TPA: hypothetical protein VHY79_17930 [Rhizomicrobium sp.]|nr:hypothetical protein [Rhizomicrobium sp.]
MSRVTRLDEARRAYVLGTIKASSVSKDRADQARHYRLRAEELRVIAEEVLLRETSRTLLSLADSYEQMAGMVENGFTRNLAAGGGDADSA